MIILSFISPLHQKKQCRTKFSEMCDTLSLSLDISMLITCYITMICIYTVKPLIAVTFTAKVRWSLFRGLLQIWERFVAIIGRWPPFGGGRYSKVAAIRRWPLFGGGRYSEVAKLRLYTCTHTLHTHTMHTHCLLLDY